MGQNGFSAVGLLFSDSLLALKALFRIQVLNLGIGTFPTENFITMRETPETLNDAIVVPGNSMVIFKSGLIKQFHRQSLIV